MLLLGLQGEQCTWARAAIKQQKEMTRPEMAKMVWIQKTEREMKEEVEKTKF